MKPHKHAELIKAWADGAEIQVLNELTKTWEDCKPNPFWNDFHEYRIKPEPKPDVILYFKYYMDRPCIYPVNTNQFPNLMLKIDGETGELKSAEVLK